MNKLAYLGLIAILFSCKSTSIAQEKENTTTPKTKIEKPRFVDTVDKEISKLSVIGDRQITPNRVHLEGTVLGVYENISICGVPYEATIKVKVTSIIGSGSGIVNLISSGQEITFGCRKGELENFKTHRKQSTKDQKIIFIVNEGLCKNMGKTTYELVSFRSKN